MRILVAAVALTLAASTACGSSEDTTEASRSPVPRQASETAPDNGVGAGHQPAAEPPSAGSNVKAAAKVCSGLARVDEAGDPAAALEDLAAQAARDRVQFRRLVAQLHRAYVDGDFEKGRTLVDRLSSLCEDVEERRNC